MSECFTVQDVEQLLNIVTDITTVSIIGFSIALVLCLALSVIAFNQRQRLKFYETHQPE